MSAIDATPQCVVVARLLDFCRFGGAVSGYESDPWLYMRGKLRELEAPLQQLKARQLASASARLRRAVADGTLGDDLLAEFRSLLDRYLSPGDFVDVAFALTPQELADAGGRARLEGQLGRVKPRSLFDEERQPPDRRAASHEKLVGEPWTRLGLDLLDRILSRRPRTARRKRMALRRLRGNVAEYCAVLHVPVSPEDTFSPFMLQRVEALAVACLRLLDRYR